MFILPVLLSGQQQKKYKTKYGIDDLSKIPAAPDFSQMKYWIAHPDLDDDADLVPGKGELLQYQESAKVDVFFIYPTIYTGRQKPENPWFADVDNDKLNKEISETTIRYQSSVFNASAKVYSPLYRQSHIGVYYRDLKLKVEALEYSYQDVRRAFSYYLDNFNNGRPIIIASHSQGTTHATSLLKEFFQGKELKKKLVAAYLIGMPLRDDTFKAIPICEDESQTGCWLSWNTYKQGYYPPNHDYWYEAAVSVNPLSWKRDSTYVSWGENKGGVLRNFKKNTPRTF